MKLIFSLILCAWFYSVSGQGYAGEDQTVCEAHTGVTLGISNPNPEHCYDWYSNVSEDDRYSPNPQVFPKKTTTYYLRVTDHDFSFVSYDHVEVKVEMGRIAIMAEPIPPNTEEPEEIQASTQLLDSEISAVVWSIAEDPDNTGCQIMNASSSGLDYGDISHCISPGTIVIRATDANNPDCFIEKDAKVNHGILDLSVEEVGGGSRIAYSGETLYVVGPSEIRFIAWTDSRYILPYNQPEWTGDLLPEEEHSLDWTIEVETEGTYVVTCSDFEVTVIVLSDEEEQFELPTDLSLWIQFADVIENLAGFEPYLCNEPPSIMVNANHQLRGIVKNMERTMSKEYYKHITVIGDVDNSYLLQSEGCALLTDYSKVYSIPGFGSFQITPSFRTDISGNNSIAIQIQLQTDEISEDLEEIDLTFYSAISLVAKPVIEFNEVEIFTSPAFMEITAKFDGDFRLTDEKIEYKTSRDGLQMNPKGYMFTGAPSNPTWKAPVNMSVNIMDGHQSVWKTFADLSSLLD
jgi:hypothetical protein